jgi:uncharacterized protein
MIVNVAQLLKSDLGTLRQYDFDEWIAPFSEEIEMAGPVVGKVELSRTNRGIFGRARFRTSVRLECSRCLELYVEELPIHFDEEYFPVVDVNTGLPVHIPHDSFAFTISDKHELDLGPAVREYGLLALPMKPLCRAECAGLCPECGVNRNVESCTCVVELRDLRFVALQKLLLEKLENRN